MLTQQNENKTFKKNLISFLFLSSKYKQTKN